MHQEYIRLITKLLPACDLATLDLIYKILRKKCQDAR